MNNKRERERDYNVVTLTNLYFHTWETQTNAYNVVTPNLYFHTWERGGS
jgi:hypothetical protein